ncbi:MAG: ABC transporter substrate-binding protein [Candidatus Rokubacteria bacterium]|nr:ABC transporter substrate-binding protein [Candidatus Rokubacteria bacterium]
MTAISRRRFLASATAAAAAGSCALPLARAQTPVKLGSAVLGDYALAGPFLLALERGMFRSENLDAEYVPFRGGPDLVKAVIAGEILIGAGGSTDVLVAREAGMPLKMIATQTEGNHFTLNVAPTITKVADLKGRAIGVTQAGATTWVFARMLARQQQWDTDRDVKIVALGGLDAQLAALARNEIAAFVWGDGGAVTQLQGKSKMLMRFDALTPKWISQILYASEDGVRKHNETIRKAMKAIFTAQRFMAQKTADAAEAIAKKIGWSVDGVLAAHKISGGLISHDGTVSIEALASVQDVLLEHGVIKKKLPIEEHLTREFTPVRFP